MTDAAASPRSKGRARLDRQTIVEAGLELAATGVASISVRELGTRLGSDPTAIYRHFRSKDALMGALLDELDSRAAAEVSAPRAQWQERLRELAAATLKWYTRFPAIGAEATVLTTHGDGELTAVEFMLDAFHTAGLRDSDLVRHYALMASQMLSGASGIARARGGDEEDSASSPWFEGPLLADPRKYPLIAQNAIALAELEDRDLFLAGVDAIIESAERTAAR
ncbi:MAG: TetR family transcriptional regulator [Microbacterium sp.]|jgi:AcrR family transcriptional regulator|nr:TetR family transcriptional regulator [Microbacterium sp.]